jgi:hypothetical protein
MRYSRSKHLRRLRKQIRRGAYEIDSHAVADEIVERPLMRLLLAPSLRPSGRMRRAA